MFDGARSVISTVLSIAAVFLVLAVIGVVNQKAPMGMGAVGDGIGDVFKWFGELLGKA
jgi:hypothetical protein